MEKNKRLIVLQQKIQHKELELMYVEDVLEALTRVQGCFQTDKVHFLYRQGKLMKELKELLEEELKKTRDMYNMYNMMIQGGGGDGDKI